LDRIMSRRFWIIALLAALLPLRGWALAVMAPAEGAVPAATVVSMPCHDSAGNAAPGSTCAACDLCHTPVAPPAFDGDVSAPVPPAAPRAEAARDTGRRHVDLLERPPRTLPR
jgi:hypothetical protein